MHTHILYFAIVGVILAFVFALADKLIANVEDAKKRKCIKIVVNVVLIFLGACAVDIIVRGTTCKD